MFFGLIVPLAFCVILLLLHAIEKLLTKVKIPFSKTFKRELEVAFSKHAQPVWLRVLKYVVFVGLIYFFWGKSWLLPLFLIILFLGFSLHFWYRHKTKAWTKSYGGWDYEKNKPKGK